MNQNIHRLLSVGILLSASFISVSLTAQAQSEPTYKVGDRIEFTESGACLPSPYSAKGTVTKVQKGDWVFGHWTGGYTIQEDPLPGRVPQVVGRPIASKECSMRAIGGAGPNIPTDTLRVDANNTVLADREQLDCDHLNHAGRNGTPPPPELIKKLIRCLYEKPSPIGQDGATKMDITSMTIASPRRWILYRDIGQGNLDTLVYPVHVGWNQKTFYRTRNVAVTGKEATFTCFADKFNLW